MRNIGKVVRRRLAPLLADRRQPGKGAGPTGARIRGARQLSHPKLGVSRSLRNWAISEVLETVALSADHMGEARAVVSIAYYSDVEPSARGEREYKVQGTCFACTAARRRIQKPTLDPRHQERSRFRIRQVVITTGVGCDAARGPGLGYRSCC